MVKVKQTSNIHPGELFTDKRDTPEIVIHTSFMYTHP